MTRMTRTVDPRVDPENYNIQGYVIRCLEHEPRMTGGAETQRDD
jgi:hypothetical protein